MVSFYGWKGGRWSAFLLALYMFFFKGDDGIWILKRALVHTFLSVFFSFPGQMDNIQRVYSYSMSMCSISLVPLVIYLLWMGYYLWTGNIYFSVSITSIYRFWLNFASDR